MILILLSSLIQKLFSFLLQEDVLIDTVHPFLIIKHKDKLLHVMNNTTKNNEPNTVPIRYISIHSFFLSCSFILSLFSLHNSHSLTHTHSHCQGGSHHSDSASPAVVCGNSLHRQEVVCVYFCVNMCVCVWHTSACLFVAGSHTLPHSASKWVFSLHCL